MHLEMGEKAKTTVSLLLTKEYLAEFVTLYDHFDTESNEFR